MRRSVLPAGIVCTRAISPAGSIKESSPAGIWLKAHGVGKTDFNSYGSRRGNHEIMMRGARSVTLDLKSAEGVAAAKKLVAKADAIIEGFRPGVMDRLGLGWAVLHTANPKLVLCSLSGWEWSACRP